MVRFRTLRLNAGAVNTKSVLALKADVFGETKFGVVGVLMSFIPPEITVSMPAEATSKGRENLMSLVFVPAFATLIKMDDVLVS